MRYEYPPPNVVDKLAYRSRKRGGYATSLDTERGVMPPGFMADSAQSDRRALSRGVHSGPLCWSTPNWAAPLYTAVWANATSWMIITGSDW